MSENLVSQTHSQQASLTSGGTHPERPPNPATPANPNRPQEYDPKPTPRVARLAAVHLWAMDHVKLDKLFPNIAHETRGHYIGDVDPIKFMHEFLPWNIDDSGPFKKFKAQKPSKKQLAALKSMATKSGESDMNRACVSTTNHILNRTILTSLSARRSSWLAQGAPRTISYYRLRRHPQLSRLVQRPWHRRSSLQ